MTRLERVEFLEAVEVAGVNPKMLFQVLDDHPEAAGSPEFVEAFEIAEAASAGMLFEHLVEIGDQHRASPQH